MLATATDAATDAGSLGWIEAALIIFFGVFVIITIGVCLRRKGHFDAAAQIPLNDQDLVTGPASSTSQGNAR